MISFNENAVKNSFKNKQATKSILKNRSPPLVPRTMERKHPNVSSRKMGLSEWKQNLAASIMGRGRREKQRVRGRGGDAASVLTTFAMNHVDTWRIL